MRRLSGRVFLLYVGPMLVLWACGSDPGSRFVPERDGGSGGGVSGNGSTGTPTNPGAGTGGVGTIDTTTPPPDPCEVENPPPEGFLVPSGPACGDGKLNQESEICDDGNSIPGDGCSGICTVELYFECPTPGQPCISTIV